MGKLSKKLISIITTLAVAAGFTFTNVAPAYAAENTVQETSVVPDDDQKAESAGKLQASSVQDGVILHAWCWSLDTIKENMAEIAAAGYTTIQTSPVQACPDPGRKTNTNADPTWYYHYQPTYYTVGNYQLGTEQDLKEMVAEAHKYNIKVIVDVVANHLTTTAGAADPELLANCHNNPNVSDWNNRTQVTQYKIIGLPDLNTSSPVVQRKMGDYLETLANDGVDGFRFDAAKSIELPAQYEIDGAPSSEYWPTVLGRARAINPDIYAYGEVLQGERAANFPGYAKIMGVTGSTYGWFVRSAVGYEVWEGGDGKLGGNGNNGKVSPKISSELVGKYMENEVKDGSIPNSRVVSFVETHDTYANSGASRCLSQTQIHLAWAMCAGREGSVPLFFNRPTTQSFGDNYLNPQGEAYKTVGERGSDDFKDPDVVAMNIFHNDMAGQSEDVSAECNNNVMKIGRGNKGLVLINVGNSTDFSISTSLPDGSYTNYSSTGGKYTVSNGRISGNIQGNSIIIIDTLRGENPPDPETPSVSISPNGGKFIGSQVVTLGYSNATSGTYSIDGGAEKSFSNGDKITIGSDAKEGTTITLTVKATNGTKTATKTASFTKSSQVVADADLYIQKPSGWGSNINAYVYDDSGALKTLSAWPGTAMKDDGSGIYSLKLPAGWTSGRVIFNDGGNQYPSGAGLEFTVGTPMIYNLDNNGGWQEYDVVPKELTVQSVTANPAAAVTLGKDVTLTGKASGGQGTKSYEYQISGADSTVVVADATGKATWKPSKPGEYTITLIVTDATGATAEKSISYTVEQGNAPYIQSVTATKSGSNYVYKVNATGGEKVGNKLLFYKYMYKDASGKYKVIHNYSRDTTITTTQSKITVFVQNSLNEEVSKEVDANNTSKDLMVSLDALTSLTQDINGASIKVKASASNVTGTVKYKFSVNNVVKQAYSTTATFNYTPTEAGVYTVKVEATDANNKIVSATQVFKINNGGGEELVLSKITPSIASPQVLGKTVKLTATAAGGTGTKQYRFLITLNGTTVAQKAYSTTAYYNWTPTTAGKYTIKAYVKDSADSIATKTMSYVINPATTFKISAFSTNLTTPQSLGKSIVMSASSTGGQGTVKYHFYAYLNGTAVQQSTLSTAKTYTWKPTKAGTYTIKVAAVDGTGKIVTATKSYVIKAAAVSPTITKFTTSVSSPQKPNTSITLQVAATGGTGTKTCKFTYSLNGGTAVTIKSYDAMNFATWKPTKAGTYTLKAYVKDSVGKIATKTMSFVISNPPTITAFKADKVSPQAVNTSITLQVAATGGTGTKQCKFTYSLNGGSETLIKNYDSISFATWKPTKAGTYTLKAYVKDDAGAVVTKTMTYVIASTPLKITSFTTSVASPQEVGKTITLSAAATGSGTVRYHFYVYSGTTIKAQSSLSTVKTYSWKPSKAGTYTLKVVATDASGKIVKATKTFVIK